MDCSNNSKSVNDLTQKNLSDLRNRQGHNVIHAVFCNKVDRDNAPLKCKECQDYPFNCAGRVQK